MIVINLNDEPFPLLREGDIYITCEDRPEGLVYHVERWDNEELYDLDTFLKLTEAIEYCLTMKRYLVVGIYEDNSQRYADTIAARDPAEAVAVAEQKGVEVAGVFEYRGNLVCPEAVA